MAREVWVNSPATVRLISLGCILCLLLTGGCLTGQASPHVQPQQQPNTASPTHSPRPSPTSSTTETPLPSSPRPTATRLPSPTPTLRPTPSPTPSLTPTPFHTPGPFQPDYEVDEAMFWQTWGEIQMGDAELGYRMRPNLNLVLQGHPEFAFRVETNSLGFRDDVTRGPVYALALGDSYTWGFGVEKEESWVEILQSQVGAEIANLGVGSYSSHQYTRLLAEHGQRFAPQVVLWQFIANDLFAEEQFTHWQASGDENLYAWRLAEWQATTPEPWQRWQATYDDERLRFVFTFGYAWIEAIQLDRPNIAQGLALSQDALLRAQQFTDELDAELIVVLFPFKEATYWHLVYPMVDRPGEYELDAPLEAMRQFCQSKGIRFVDLTPPLKELARAGEQLYFRQNGHLNQSGNWHVAQILYAYMRDNNLLPKR